MIVNYWLVKLKSWLLYLFLFLLPFQTRLILWLGELNGYWEYGTMSVYFVEMLLWLIVAMSIIEWLARKEFPISNFQFLIKSKFLNAKIGLGILIIGLIFAIHALSPLLSFYWLLHFFEGLAIFLVIRYSTVEWRKLSMAFIAGAVLQASLAIWQFAAQSVFASKWLGMAVQNPSILGTSVVEAAGGRFLRAYGSLPHPNILGAYLVLVLILFFWLVAYNCHPRESGDPEDDFTGFPIRSGMTFKKLCLSIVAVALLAIGIFFSFSRAAWLGLFLATVFSVFAALKIHAKRDDRHVLREFYILPISAVVIFMILGFTFWPLVQTRSIGGERLEVKSNVERLSGYSEALQIVKNHPWLGVGPGNYTLAVHDEIDSTRPSWAYQPVHNIYLLALAELGVFGFATLIVMIIFSLKIIYRKHCGQNSATAEKLPRYFLSLTLLFILAFLFLFDHFFWSLPFGIWLFWSIIGLLSKIFSDYVRTSFT